MSSPMYPPARFVITNNNGLKLELNTNDFQASVKGPNLTILHKGHKIESTVNKITAEIAKDAEVHWEHAGAPDVGTVMESMSILELKRLLKGLKDLEVQLRRGCSLEMLGTGCWAVSKHHDDRKEIVAFKIGPLRALINELGNL